jgi:hypothetical protein
VYLILLIVGKILIPNEFLAKKYFLPKTIENVFLYIILIL